MSGDGETRGRAPPADRRGNSLDRRAENVQILVALGVLGLAGTLAAQNVVSFPLFESFASSPFVVGMFRFFVYVTGVFVVLKVLTISLYPVTDSRVIEYVHERVEPFIYFFSLSGILLLVVGYYLVQFVRTTFRIAFDGSNVVTAIVVSFLALALSFQYLRTSRPRLEIGEPFVQRVSDDMPHDVAYLRVPVRAERADASLVTAGVVETDFGESVPVGTRGIHWQRDFTCREHPGLSSPIEQLRHMGEFHFFDSHITWIDAGETAYLNLLLKIEGLPATFLGDRDLETSGAETYHSYCSNYPDGVDEEFAEGEFYVTIEVSGKRTGTKETTIEFATGPDVDDLVVA